MNGTLTTTKIGDDYATIGNCNPQTGYPDLTLWPYDGTFAPTYPSVSNWYIHTIDEPKFCIGKAHVFECEHVDKCKCGAIKRVMPKARKAGRHGLR